LLHRRAEPSLLRLGGNAHLCPEILPGKRGVLFTIWTNAPTWEAQLAVADPTTGHHKIVLPGGAFGRYTSSGHLVFWRGSALMAAPFDLATLEVRGEPVKVVSDVRMDDKSGAAHFAISDSGTLAYIKGRLDPFAVSFVLDRSRKQLTRLDESEPAGRSAFSSDGKRVAHAVQRRHVRHWCLRSRRCLTGLHNLRSFGAQLTEMVRASRASNAPLAMLVLDAPMLTRSRSTAAQTRKRAV
jgi:hypothetical protein